MQIDRAFNVEDDMTKLPKFRQTQRSTEDQLRDLRVIANRLGLYDAADYIQFEQKEVK